MDIRLGSIHQTSNLIMLILNRVHCLTILKFSQKFSCQYIISLITETDEQLETVASRGSVTISLGGREATVRNQLDKIGWVRR